jgi:predicted nucleic acid binding AN1-type Zn finger protein
LRPKGRGRGGGGGYKGGFRRQGESREEPRREKRILGAASDTNHTQAHEALAPNSSTPQIGEPDRDQMWHLMQQLSMMLKQNSSTNTSKNSGIVVNFTSKFSQQNWILDSGATDHITGNKNLLRNFTNWNTNQFVTVVNGEK